VFPNKISEESLNLGVVIDGRIKLKKKKRSQDNVQRQALMNTVMNLHVLQKAGNFLTS